MSRILVLVPGALDADVRARRAAADEAVGLAADLALDHRAVPRAPLSAWSPADRVLADVAFLDAGLAAERDGYAAVVIDAFADEGLAALRSRLSIPVVGPGKASLLYGLTLANRFSVLVPEGAVPRARAFVRECGLERHCASVRAPGPGLSEAAIAAAIEACVAEGAEAVVLADPATRPFAGAIQRRASVPVVEPYGFALKLAESLLALRLTQSRRAYPAPMVEKDALLHALLRPG